MRPYISVCMGIGGTVSESLLDRLRRSLQENTLFGMGYHIPMEVVVCDWGEKLRENIHGPRPDLRPDELPPVRIIHVPQSVHDSLPNPHKLPYFEFQPKNVAIRRAKGEWILSTNPDDIWSTELADFFSRRLLQRGHFYRINRHDTKNGEVYRICYETGCYPPNATEAQIKTPIDSRAHPWGGLHFNAAGDFLLMERWAWFDIHGHPERDYSHTVDGQSVFLAHQKGLKQIILKHPIYHPDHARTLNINSEGKVIAPAWNDNEPFTKENDDSWGCAGMEFEETCL